MKSWFSLTFAAFLLYVQPVWAEEMPMEGYAAMQEEAAPYQEAQEKTLQFLLKGNQQAIHDSLSQSFMDAVGPETIALNMPAVIGFFSDYARDSNNTTVTPATDQSGHSGYSFFRGFISKSGEQKFYSITIVEEDGNLVIANIIPNRQFVPN